MSFTVPSKCYSTVQSNDRVNWLLRAVRPLGKKPPSSLLKGNSAQSGHVGIQRALSRESYVADLRDGWIQFNTLIVCRQDVHLLGLSRPLCGRKNVKIPLRSKTYENPTAPIEQLSSEMVLSYIAHYTTWCQMMSQNTKHTEATAKDWNRVLWLVVGVVWFSHPLGVSCLIRFWLLYAQVSMNIVKFITSTWTPKAPESPLKSPPGPKSLTRKRCAYAPCPPPHPGHKNKDCQVRPSPSIKPSNHATSEIS